MRIYLKKSLKHDDFQLNKDQEGIVQWVQINSKEGDNYYVNFEGHEEVPVLASLIEFGRDKVTVTIKETK